MNHKHFKASPLARIIAVALLLSFSLTLFTSYSALAADPPPPGPPKGPGGTRCGQVTCGSSANLIFRDLDKLFSPNIATPGKTVTMTIRVRAEGYKSDMQADNSSIEIPLYSDQKVVSYNQLNTNWTLRDPEARTLFIDMGTLKNGNDGTVQLVTTVPADLNKPIMEMVLYLNWDDEGGRKHKGSNVLLPLNVPQPGPVVLPPAPSGQAPSDLPTSGPFAPQAAPPADQPNTVTSWYIAATRHNLSGDFLTYWLEHGSVLVLGYPISEMFQEQESGLVVQYFERGVMEAHPENEPPYNVLLKSLGRELDKATPSVPGDNAPSTSSVYYPDTGHWLDGRFVSYWQKNGGLAQFGFPISEPTMENGKLVQWTERARFELDMTTGFTPLVQLGLVGNEFAKFKGYLFK